MITLLILFVISLIGISFMIGRKLIFIRNGGAHHVEHSKKIIPDFSTIRDVFYQKSKKGVYIITVFILRLYIQSGNSLKHFYTKMQNQIQKIAKTKDQEENKEASKFLKMISDYKNKVRNIKKQIEEENQ